MITYTEICEDYRESEFILLSLVAFNQIPIETIAFYEVTTLNDYMDRQIFVLILTRKQLYAKFHETFGT